MLLTSFTDASTDIVNRKGTSYSVLLLSVNLVTPLILELIVRTKSCAWTMNEYFHLYSTYLNTISLAAINFILQKQTFSRLKFLYNSFFFVFAGSLKKAFEIYTSINPHFVCRLDFIHFCLGFQLLS